jgi:hypothetical protein
VACGADWVVEYAVFEEEILGFLVKGMSSSITFSGRKLIWW